MSEQAQGETKWRLGELALVSGHAGALSLWREQEKGARAARKTLIFADLRYAEDIFRHKLTISLSSREDNSPYACCHRDVMGASPRKPNGCSSLSSEGSECMLALLLSSLSFLCVQ